MRLEHCLSPSWVERVHRLRPSLVTAEGLLEYETTELMRILQCDLSEVEQLKQTVALAVLHGSKVSSGLVSQYKTLDWSSWSVDVHSVTSKPRDSATLGLRTGLPELDAMLGCGLARGHCTQLLADSGHGKTQVTMQCSVTAALAGESVVVVDTSCAWNIHRLNNLFRFSLLRERLLQNLNKDTRTEERDETAELQFQIEQTEAMEQCIVNASEKIIFARKIEFLDGINFLSQVADLPQGEGPQLLIIDSLRTWIAPYLAIGSLQTRSQSMTAGVTKPTIRHSTLGATSLTVQPWISQLYILLRTIAEKHKCAVVVTDAPQLLPQNNTRTTMSGTTGPNMDFVMNHILTEIAANRREQLNITGSGGVADLTDVFDTSILLVNSTLQMSLSYESAPGSEAHRPKSSFQEADRLDTFIAAHVLTRPPYFGNNPESAHLHFSRVERKTN